MNENMPFPPRLVPDPVFLLSAVRSGSTMLRYVLDTHSRVHAPHELNLPDLTVQAKTLQSTRALEAMGLSPRDLEHLLWDRLLHRHLESSGKDVLVEKTPFNLSHWRRLAECWPEARFIFLLRHPAHVLESMLATTHGRLGVELRQRYGPEAEIWNREDAARDMLSSLLENLVEARKALPGLTVRYEELTAQPERTVRTVCDFLGVAWEPEMLTYGNAEHGPRGVFLGDDSERLDAGRILPGRPLPDWEDVPEALRESCQALGYGTA